MAPKNGQTTAWNMMAQPSTDNPQPMTAGQHSASTAHMGQYGLYNSQIVVTEERHTNVLSVPD